MKICSCCGAHLRGKDIISITFPPREGARLKRRYVCRPCLKEWRPDDGPREEG